VTTERQPCPSFGELADYWTSDIAADEAERIEAHVFGCERCARLLAEAERLRTGIGALAQSGGVQAFVNDDILNRLARDGVRVRSYALGPGESVRCAVWAGDDLLVTRLRANFAGVNAVDAEMRLDSGEEWAHTTDIPVREGATELVMALPAALVRTAPTIPMRLTLRASDASRSDRVLAEYIFNHEGALERGPSSNDRG
jgi:anti-sigma factor ChrR (cupin superfamily)